MNEMHPPVGQRRRSGRVRTALPIGRGDGKSGNRCHRQEDDVAGALADFAGTSVIDKRIVAIVAVAVSAATVAGVSAGTVAGMTGMVSRLAAGVTVVIPGGDGLGTMPAVEVAHRGHGARRQPDGHPERGHERPPPALPVAKPCLPVAFVSH